MRALTLAELIFLNLLRDKERGMIEIKGLGQNVQAARDAIKRARDAVQAMNTNGAELEQTATDIAATFKKHTADLLFEATQLGNSPPATDEKPGDTFQQPGAGNGAIHE